ncbi:MAG: hypothetical protein EOP48_12105 [Sphingobacteriales bacterium]|nr:MAG: hypothetical protein EOP48_12105 [Sphingobacteriales bacterium]
MNEVAGIGNHYTALFWEYDSRLGKRWNRDPKGIFSISDYAAFKNNPNIYTDHLGDFNSKFGAWAYQKLHGGGGKIDKDEESGQWFINKKDEFATLLRAEAIFYYLYLKFYVENDKDGVFNFISTHDLDLVNNQMFTYLGANLHLNNQQSAITRSCCSPNI